MQSEQANGSWYTNELLTLNPSTRRHHREASLSSLGSASPASPYNATTSNPQVAGDAYHDFNLEYTLSSSKSLPPAQTPLPDHFLAPHYDHYYNNTGSLPYAMGHNGSLKQAGDGELMPAPDFGFNDRSTAAANRDSPTTPPYFEERNKHGYRNAMPKLLRTITDIYADELYSPNFQVTSASTAKASSNVAVSPQNDIFNQRLKAANTQHLHASKINVPLAIPSREKSPFRQGSPLAPTNNSFEHQSANVIFGTATHLRVQQKVENDARAIQRQLDMASPEQSTPKTISPKDVDLVYHENEADASVPLFPPEPSRQSPSHVSIPIARQGSRQESAEIDDNASQRSFASMATTRRESSSAYSTSSQTLNHQSRFNFVPPAVPTGIGQQHQQLVLGPARSQQQARNSLDRHDAISTTTDFNTGEHSAQQPGVARPSGASADTGTYTCTYHGCTLRFDSPTKLQRHKREGHRNSASINGDDRIVTSTALQRNSQAGPHKCERINPSTGKPCNTIFSRPYDLTRHEDTIHNARKQKVRCHLCTEEKTFSRNDALTRHFRVVHPDHLDSSRCRRRGIHD